MEMEPREETLTPLPTATPATEWRRIASEGEYFQLPGSGHTARLRRPSLIARSAGVSAQPNPLTMEVLRLIALDTTGSASTRSTEAQITAFADQSTAFIEIAQLCLVEPRMVRGRQPNYEAGEIGPEDLADADYIWLYFSFVEGRSAQTIPFRLTPRT